MLSLLKVRSAIQVFPLNDSHQANNLNHNQVSRKQAHSRDPVFFTLLVHQYGVNVTILDFFGTAISRLCKELWRVSSFKPSIICHHHIVDHEMDHLTSLMLLC